MLQWIPKEAWLPLLLAIFACSTQTAMAEPSDDQSGIQVRLGLGDTWKLGHVCPVRIAIPSSLRSAASGVEVTSVDGDGVELVYRSPVRSGSASVSWVPIRIGRQTATLEVRVVDADGGVLAEVEMRADEVATGLSSAQPLIVALGSSMGVEQLSRTSADGKSATFSTSVITSPDQLPPHWDDYSSCELIVISTRDPQFLQNISKQQWEAIDRWIRRGGGCIISLGAEATQLSSLQSLVNILPGKITGVSQVTNPGPLESFIATAEEPIDAFPVSLVELRSGTHAKLSLSDRIARRVPWWVVYAHGHGTIRFIASDLEHPSFAQWPDRRLLWERLLKPYVDHALLEGSGGETQVGDSSYLGYRDLVGQLRATLDVFPSVRVVSFGQIAALLVAILLLIGPVDYFVSVKWLRRPDFSWYLAGTLLLAITAGLTWWYGSIRPDDVRINSAQIIDIDSVTGAVNGRLWSHVYSGSARRLNIEALNSDAQIPVRLGWQGLPGRGLGGLLSQFNTNRGMPAYGVHIDANGQTRLEGVGIPAAGTKCLFATWTDSIDLTAASELKEISGVDQIQGQLVNPLNVDLKDPMVFYHNWYYRLDSRIPARQAVTISQDTVPRDLARRLNGRQALGQDDATTRWDPADRGSLDRLLELMMFHKAAAGQTYTSLMHRYQPQVDHSNLLETDHAILVGRIDEPPVTIRVTASEANGAGAQPQVRDDVSRTWCRITIPVQKNS